MTQQKKERVWKKLCELETKMNKASEQIINIKDSIRANEKIKQETHLYRLQVQLEAVMIELIGIGAVEDFENI